MWKSQFNDWKKSVYNLIVRNELIDNVKLPQWCEGWWSVGKIREGLKTCEEFPVFLFHYTAQDVTGIFITIMIFKKLWKEQNIFFFSCFPQEIGWRSVSRRIIVYSSNSLFHLAGAGKVGKNVHVYFYVILHGNIHLLYSFCMDSWSWILHILFSHQALTVKSNVPHGRGRYSLFPHCCVRYQFLHQGLSGVVAYNADKLIFYSSVSLSLERLNRGNKSLTFLHVFQLGGATRQSNLKCDLDSEGQYRHDKIYVSFSMWFLLSHIIVIQDLGNKSLLFSDNKSYHSVKINFIT